MKYMLLIYHEESKSDTSDEKLMELMGQYAAYTNEMIEAGVFVATEGLQPTATATTIQVRKGEMLTTHGPFAETKEQLGGFVLIECANLDEALSWAAKCPNALDGKIEVRPVADISQA